MKKIAFLFCLIVLVLVCLVSADAMAGGSTPPSTNTFQGCLQRPYIECSQFGHPWAPNNKTDANGTALPLCSEKKTITVYGRTVLAPCYDPTKPTYDPLKWNACAQPIYAECRTKFGK